MISLKSFQFQEQSIANLIQQTVTQFIVRPSGLQGGSGVSGFLFDVIDREEFGLHADITDNFVENNTAVQDHIALHPERFTLRGFVGELNQIQAGALGEILSILRTIQNIRDMQPVFTIGANQVYEGIAEVALSANRAVSQLNELYSLFNSKSTTNERQQNAYNYFYSLWKTRQLVTVETPYGVVSEMAIEEVSAVQSGDTRFVSEFSVTFKRIRTVQTMSIAGLTDAVPVINAANQQAPEVLAESESGGGGSAVVGSNQNIGGSWPPPPTSSPTVPDYGRFANIASLAVDNGIFSSLTARTLTPGIVFAPMLGGR